jgi:hypothetical protein
MQEQALQQSSQGDDSVLLPSGALDRAEAIDVAQPRWTTQARLAAGVTLLAVAGVATALARRDHGSSPAIGDSPMPHELWGGSEVRCGGQECDCGWAMGGQLCYEPSEPLSHCWGCCCSRLYPDAYHRAVHDPYGHRRGYEPERHCNFHAHRGEKVTVRNRRGLSHGATVLRRVGEDAYEVRYGVTHARRVVSGCRMRHGSPWYMWLLWILLGLCLISACVGLIGYLLNEMNKKKGRASPLPSVDDFLPEEKPDRTCRGCTS